MFLLQSLRESYAVFPPLKDCSILLARGFIRDLDEVRIGFFASVKGTQRPLPTSVVV